MRKAVIIFIIIFSCLFTKSQSVPNTHTFALSDVQEVVLGSVYDWIGLSYCFSVATDSKFDVSYKGSKDRLSNFRNYNAVTCSELATISTTSMVYSSSGTAQAEVNMSTPGTNCTVTEMGMCYGTSANPTIAGSHTATPTVATGAYSWGISGLTDGTTYHYRAYATNSYGTAYGSDQTYLQSGATLATVTTASVTVNSSTTATGGGNVTSDGNATVTDRGIVWHTSTNPTITSYLGLQGSGSGTGSYACDMTYLEPCVTYYVRAYATNSVGTAYGSNTSFSTSTTRPIGLSQYLFVTAVDNGATPVTSGNICTLALSGTSIGSTGQSAGSDGSITYTGTGTDCTRLSDGYYLCSQYYYIVARIQVIGGRWYNACP